MEGLAQRHIDWGCLLVLPLQTSNVDLGVRAGRLCGSPAPERRSSADSSQTEKASLQICCSASSVHGRARTEAQRLGLLACLATTNFKRTFGLLFQAPPAALLPKCECLQIARRQIELAWNAVAQPHLPMALLAQRQRDWGCFLVLPPQTANIAVRVRAGRLW